MKPIGEYFEKSVIRKRKELARHIKKQIYSWALDAHKLDPTKPIKYYHAIFLNRLRETYKTSCDKDKFFEEVIEV